MRREEVEFLSEGTTVRGWLYRPEGSTEDVPAVVLAGGWCYVRELVMPYYAEAFAEAGIAALVFDYRNLGVSDGEPRQHLDPTAQIRDYQNAVSFLERTEGIDADRLGAWGISYSGGHVLVLAATDPRVKAIVSQIPVVDGYRNMRRIHGTMGWRRLWSSILEDRQLRYDDPSKRLYLPHASEDPENELSAWPFPETKTTFAQLQATEAPLYQNLSTMESVDLLLDYDVNYFVDRIYDTPSLMIVAEGDDLTLWDLEIESFNSIPTHKKELVVLPHTSHMTLYSDRDKLAAAAAHATTWFVRHLVPEKATD
ncbi:alpha/beta hydrolase [Aeromicrobium stalagmiti]|uniref:alpha/beta hydrolase n=1 Tax=Aeromicrobium stalagmiti TaxID=2738988 RepID=UPI001567E490|nr:alpha/beta fold hydrolase [Aeromicrobium stalagmiti]NRQ48715.1 alpha/beta fold hydrolase [Aeromicrobium stalagmiti]